MLVEVKLTGSEIKAAAKAMAEEHSWYYADGNNSKDGEFGLRESEDGRLFSGVKGGSLSENSLHLQWRSSAGNTVTMDWDKMTVTFTGRRHGIRRLLRFFDAQITLGSVEEYDTSLPTDYPWWYVASTDAAIEWRGAIEKE